ncbi:MAG: YfiM family protein [Bacteroidia bacterium]|nr:YfiM family protein [Bacteroidia bacterium]
MQILRSLKTWIAILSVGCKVALGQDTLTKQHFLTNDTLFNPKKFIPISIASGSIITAGTVYLTTSWYRNTKQTSFHWFNDWPEWRQMDKVGHATTAFQFCRISDAVLKWSGCPPKTQLIVSSAVGFGLMLSIEVLDGFSDKWGASYFDLAANTAGIGLYMLNKKLFNENIISLKMSYHDSPYAADHPDELGKGITRYVKDYNGQTYWLTCRIKPFLNPNRTATKFIPAWLVPAIGYGAEGLIGGYGQDPISVINAREYRQWYLSLDIDLTAIKVKNPWLKLFLGTINFIHLPMPALEFSKKGVFFRPLYF